MWRFLLLLPALIGCSEINNVFEGETVKEVETLLAKDPNLPRLTRGEILSLIKEIREGKDVVIVLPENANSTNFTTVTTTTTPVISTSKKPIKRRRKPLRPVYRHTTTGKPTPEHSFNTTNYNKESTRPLFRRTTVKPATEYSFQTNYSQETARPLFITPESTMRPVSFNTVTTRFPTTSTSMTPLTDFDKKPDVSVAAESLGQDMKQLLNTFGLLGTTSTTEKVTFQGSLTPTVDPSSYSRFKPLPLEADGMSPEMKSFLSSYGLIDKRKSKSVQTNGKEKSVLKGKKLNHVFNPATIIQNNDLELTEVNKILSKLRQFSEGNVTEFDKDEVDKLLLLENNTRLASQQSIDPASDLFEDSQDKNEIKRQQPNSTESETVTESVTVTDETGTVETTTMSSNDTDSTPSESGTEEGREPSVDELEESFGGEGDTTTARPNGFYFLLDWNSFIDVGLEDRQVNINFSPKVGDPKQFVSVRIP